MICFLQSKQRKYALFISGRISDTLSMIPLKEISLPRKFGVRFLMEILSLGLRLMIPTLRDCLKLILLCLVSSLVYSYIKYFS